MPRERNARALERLGPGRHACGNSLFLVVRPSGARSWLWRYTVDGRTREVGLGSYPVITLAMARDRVLGYRRELAAGRDPLAARVQARRAEETFHTVADALIDARAPGWKNPKSAAQWRASLETYVYGVLGDLHPAEIDAERVVEVLRPVWLSKPVTAARVRQRIEMVLDAARVRGLRDGPNPATLKGNIALLLPTARHRPKHHSAAGWRSMKPIMRKLAAAEGIAAKAVRFIALTAARASEARLATWGEIDQRTKTWTVPASWMKGGRPHAVPLSPAALAVLAEVRSDDANDDDLIFSNASRKALSLTALSKALARAGAGDATVHGLRSTFRDWCRDNGENREAAEAALAHVLESDVERAYARSDLIDQRRGLMERWAKVLVNWRTNDSAAGAASV